MQEVLQKSNQAFQPSTHFESSFFFIMPTNFWLFMSQRSDQHLVEGGMGNLGTAGIPACCWSKPWQLRMTMTRNPNDDSPSLQTSLRPHHANKWSPALWSFDSGLFLLMQHLTPFHSAVHSQGHTDLNTGCLETERWAAADRNRGGESSSIRSCTSEVSSDVAWNWDPSIPLRYPYCNFLNTSCVRLNNSPPQMWMS